LLTKKQYFQIWRKTEQGEKKETGKIHITVKGRMAGNRSPFLADRGHSAESVEREIKEDFHQGFRGQRCPIWSLFFLVVWNQIRLEGSRRRINKKEKEKRRDEKRREERIRHRRVADYQILKDWIDRKAGKERETCKPLQNFIFLELFEEGVEQVLFRF